MVVSQKRIKSAFKAFEYAYKLNPQYPLMWFWLHQIPVFKKASNSEIVCTQIDFFDMYLAREIFRSMLIADIFLTAAETTSACDLQAPSILLAYTSAFHLLKSYLATENVAVVDYWEDCGVEQFDERSQPEGVTIKIREQKGKDIFARYTKQSGWCFEEKRKSHSHLWKELANILSSSKKKLPECFKKLFLDLSSYGPYEHKGKFDKEQIEICLKELAGLRHSAHYRGEFFDDFTSDLIDNEIRKGEVFRIPTDIISTLLIEFAQDFFKMLGIFICDQITVLNKIPESFGKDFLRWIIFTPKIEERHAVKKMPNRKGIYERTEIVGYIYKLYVEPLLNKYNKVKNN